MILKEMIDDSITNDLEKEVIRLRSEGYKDCEIAQKMNINVMQISRAGKAVQQRFERKEKE